jgi:hypothetical protein
VKIKFFILHFAVLLNFLLPESNPPIPFDAPAKDWIQYRENRGIPSFFIHNWRVKLAGLELFEADERD